MDSFLFDDTTGDIKLPDGQIISAGKNAHFPIDEVNSETMEKALLMLKEKAQEYLATLPATIRQEIERILIRKEADKALQVINHLHATYDNVTVKFNHIDYNSISPILANIAVEDILDE